jgi:hypothetical protein
MAGMPSGREYHKSTTFALPQLSGQTLASLRGPPEPKSTRYDSDDSGSDGPDTEDPVGALPGTGKDYAESSGRVLF